METTTTTTETAAEVVAEEEEAMRVVGRGQEQRGGFDGASGGWEVVEEFAEGLGGGDRGRESPRRGGVEVFGAGEVAGVAVVAVINCQLGFLG
nr:hypothetical protein CFP56_41964 [Quercus suber]